MKIVSMYSVKIKDYNHIFMDSVRVYREAVDWYIQVCLEEWDEIRLIDHPQARMNYIQSITVSTKAHPSPKYDFGRKFYKMPVYLRRSAIMEATGRVSSYKSNLSNWERDHSGKEPSLPKAGKTYPVLYRDNMFVQTGTYTAQIKVRRFNTWDWLPVDLKKSDVDYIERHCANRKVCAPTLQKRGKQWYLDFPFEEKVSLNTTPIKEQKVLAVDLGINNACTCSVLRTDGTIAGREFLKLPAEYDSLNHKLNKVKQAQQNRNHKTPRLWASAKGTNDRISVLTAQFIIEKAVQYDADVIVFEKLDPQGKKKGGKKQKLHLWRAWYVQEMVTHKAHRLGIRISHICAWNTSRLAFDGSGRVTRNINGSYSICQFQSGKIYNCDLNASYNIGARYFIRELLKSCSETDRLRIWANVPECRKRTTCTLSSLIRMNAVLYV